jgi:hypothetical protein
VYESFFSLGKTQNSCFLVGRTTTNLKNGLLLFFQVLLSDLDGLIVASIVQGAGCSNSNFSSPLAWLELFLAKTLTCSGQ